MKEEEEGEEEGGRERLCGRGRGGETAWREQSERGNMWWRCVCVRDLADKENKSREGRTEKETKRAR